MLALISQTRGQRCPSIVDEYMIYQSLIGAMPLSGITAEFVDAVSAISCKRPFARRSCRRAGSIRMSDYEGGVEPSLTAFSTPRSRAEFQGSFAFFARRAALLGALNSLCQLTLKATVPGVPDFYQGTEVVGPLVGRSGQPPPVDFAARSEILRDLDRERVGIYGKLGGWNRQARLDAGLARSAAQIFRRFSLWATTRPLAVRGT